MNYLWFTVKMNLLLQLEYDLESFRPPHYRWWMANFLIVQQMNKKTQTGRLSHSNWRIHPKEIQYMNSKTITHYYQKKYLHWWWDRFVEDVKLNWENNNTANNEYIILIIIFWDMTRRTLFRTDFWKKRKAKMDKYQIETNNYII